MSISTELEQVATNLNSALTEINTQLTAKGGTPSSTVRSVASAVENLPSGSGDTQEYFVDFNPINASPEKYIYCYVTLNGEEI